MEDLGTAVGGGYPKVRVACKHPVRIQSKAITSREAHIDENRGDFCGAGELGESV